MNLPESGFLAGVLVGGVWGFSVGYQYGPLLGLLGGVIGGTVGLAGAAVTVGSWVGLMALWERSNLQNVLPEAAAGLLVLLLSIVALGGVPVLLVCLTKMVLRTTGLTGGS